MSKLLAMMMKPKNYMYATIKGSLTDNNGVFSGFDSSNYLALQNNINLSNNFEIKIKFTPSSDTTGSKKFLSLFYTNSIYLDFYTSGTTPRIDCQYSGGAYWAQIASNLSYDIPIIITIRGNGTTLNVEVNQNNNSQSGSKTLQELGIENITTNNIYFGRGHTTSLPMIDGSIDLNQSYIKIQNTKYQIQAVVGYTVVGSPTITDGVASGFSQSNYITANKPSTINSFEINIKVNFSSLERYQYFFGDTAHYGIQLYYTPLDNIIKIRYGNGSSSPTIDILSNITINTNYTINCKIVETTAIVTTQIENQQPITNAYTLNFDVVYDSNKWIFGRRYVNENGYLLGSIDLNETYIKIDGKLWFNGQPTE